MNKNYIIEVMIAGVKIPSEFIKIKKGVEIDEEKLFVFVHFLLGLDIIIDVIEIRK